MKYFLILILFISSNIFASDWLQLAPATSPSIRGSHSQVSIDQNNVMMFGGNGAGNYNDTWIYNSIASNWTQIATGTTPPVRSGHSMALLTDDKVLMYGGINAGAEKNDTYVYDLSDQNWTLLAPAQNPGTIAWFKLTQLSDGIVFKYGGSTGGTPNNETWIYNNAISNWVQLTPTTNPTAVDYLALSYIGDDKVLLFGGLNTANNSLNETWLFDYSENNWTQLNPTLSPSIRSLGELVYMGDDKVLLFGGNISGVEDDETWEFDISENTWKLVSVVTDPSARYGYSASSNSNLTALLFGGTDSGTNYQDTWSFNLTTTPFMELTPSFSNLNPNEVDLSFTITQDGGVAITDRGFVYSTSTNPTISDNKISSGTGIGSISISLSNLTPGILYYVRPFATNSLGTSYGSELSFSTPDIEDHDIDGVSNSDEDSAPNSGDGNNDGLQDSQQANVASLRGISGSYITVQLVSCDSLLNVENFLRTENDNFEFPFGVISFSAPCSEAQVKIYYHNVNDLSLYSYRKETASGIWIEYEDSEFSIETIDGEQVAVATLTLSDGGIGDSDGIVNGIIVDPGGPAIPITANIPIWNWWISIILIPVVIYIYKTTK